MNNRSTGFAGLVSLLLLGCGGGGASNQGSVADSTTGPMELIEVSTGNGLILPLKIFPPTPAGMPDTTKAPISITSRDILTANLRPTNPVLAPVQWPSRAVLSTQLPGNHFVLVRFNQAIQLSSVLSDSSFPGINNLTGAIEVVAVDPMTGLETPVAGRGFVEGKTFGSADPMNATKRLLETWVEPNGLLAASAPQIGANRPGLGFPGTQSVVPGINNLLSRTAFVFVADKDNNLSTLERFPTGVQIHVRFKESVLNTRGRSLKTPGIAASRVSPSINPAPDIEPIAVMMEPDMVTLQTIPRDGTLGVDPAVVMEIGFTKPVQISTLGPYEDGTPPNLASAVLVEYGTVTNRVRVPYSVAPRSVYDFTHMQLRPIVPFVPANPNNNDLCSSFSDIMVTLVPDGVTGLGVGAMPLAAPRRFGFSVGDGPALINNVVLPDAIYVGRRNALSVVDLNGYGQGPGNPTFDNRAPIKEGNTNFPNNLNMAVNGSALTPVLRMGQCTVDGGSEGVFTLCKDSALNDKLLTSPVIESVNDIAIGHSLDLIFNNGAPFGCQSGSNANTCASTASIKNIQIVVGAGTSFMPSDGFGFIISAFPDSIGNMVSWAPHPNPPALIFPPACFSPLIGAAEPTSTDSVGMTGLSNILTPGSSPQGDPSRNEVPNGILADVQNAFFQGPSLPNADINNCRSYMMRQQIGQFMYVIDRQRGEVVVLNSNRFNVLDRILMPDPTSFAMSPDLDFLAVTNQSANQVYFVDTNPVSPTFHQIVQTTNVGVGPTGIAWTPGNEDILVCNTTESSMTIISAFTFMPRKTISSQIRSPLEVAITGRQVGYGLNRGVYFAYILNGDGTVAVFESGPDGVAGIGFDDTILSLPFSFQNPKTIQPDSSSFNSQVWVVHENQLTPGNGVPTGRTGGAVSLVRIASGLTGPQGLGGAGTGNSNARDLQWAIAVSIGSDQLSGTPVDIAFDNMVSRSASENFKTPFTSRPTLMANGKSILRHATINTIRTVLVANNYEYIFLAVPDSSSGSGGAIDVIERNGHLRVDTNLFRTGIQSIPASDVSVVADFFRQ